MQFTIDRFSAIAGAVIVTGWCEAFESTVTITYDGKDMQTVSFRVDRPDVAAAYGGHPAGLVYAFLTTEPNEIVKPIRPKAMPVILHDEDFDRWLRVPINEALTLAAPYPSQLMVVD